ncbi:aminotransferase class V-fold PLP-dependent enzyme [Luteococcus sp. OSA5]|uniref:aminotransferase class V-fold PLP-dependent enzyme n=1 Tax=Luteococcus sp. OSA5 TaxID=3401630 RepID=UPI003B429001
MELDRRTVLSAAGLSAAGAVGSQFIQADQAFAKAHRPGHRPLPVAPKINARRLARHEPYWARVRREYDVPRDYVNYENGYFGTMPVRVRDEFQHWADVLARDSSYFMRTEFGAKQEAARKRVARLVGADLDEVVFTRGATEALQKLIGGYNQLKPGDQVLYADLDYDSMQYAMEDLRARRGAEVVKRAIPEPATHENVLDFYRTFLKDHPRAKLLLITHLSHRTGLVVPVREIVEMAEERGVDVVVDAAHSIGQMDVDAHKLGAAFIGYNLHKWISAPMGLGVMYIRKDKLASIDRDHGDLDYPETDIRSRVHTGTTTSSNLLALEVALDFHEALGLENVHRRLQYLRDRWVEQVLDVPRLQILTPQDDRMYGALTAFRIEGRVTKADSTAITSWLMDNHRVFTVRRGGVSKGEVVRVTPGIYSTRRDSDRLARALQQITKVF